MNNSPNLKVDFIGVGAEKTGSTWLYRCLLEHPQICGFKDKETIFFDTTKIIGRKERRKSDYEQFGIEYYAKYFSHCPPNSTRGEFTTTYLHDKKVAKIIHENFPGVKIIILLRNPSEKSFAQYIGLEGLNLFDNFEEALEKEPELLRRSTYTEYVQEYIRYFPREDIFIGIFEEMTENPLKFIQDVYAFLGVDKDFIPSGYKKKVDSEEIKILTAFRNKMLTNKVARLCISASQIMGINILLKNIMLLFIRKPQIKRGTRNRLKQYFSADIDNLEKLLGRSLKVWR